jgi:hypothetical protein
MIYLFSPGECRNSILIEAAADTFQTFINSPFMIIFPYPTYAVETLYLNDFDINQPTVYHATYMHACIHTYIT